MGATPRRFSGRDETPGSAQWRLHRRLELLQEEQRTLLARGDHHSHAQAMAKQADIETLKELIVNCQNETKGN